MLSVLHKHGTPCIKMPCVISSKCIVGGLGPGLDSEVVTVQIICCESRTQPR